MTMDDELEGFKSVSLPLYVVMEPILNEMNDNSAGFVKVALKKAEKNNPGFTTDLIVGILQAQNTQVDLTMTLLKLCAYESEEYTIKRTEQPFVRLQQQSQSLKKILATLPDVAVDRPKFLQTIKEIASGIRELLEAVNVLFREHAAFNNADRRKALDSHKRNFIRSSKAFSDTLKTFFRSGNIEVVYHSAINLVTEVNTILKILNA